MDETGWRWSSNELMERIEEWAEAWPESAVEADCDDAAFASSAVWLVSLGRRFGRNVGVMAVYVPQCTSEKPTTITLTPQHRDGLIEALRRTARARAE